MIPIRVTPPEGPLIDIETLRRECRLMPDEHDFDHELLALEAAAVSKLDGWQGILGRCIQRQVWAVTLDVAGAHTLPFPDVVEVSADIGAAALLPPDPLGSRVEVSQPCTLTMVLALPEAALPTIKLAVCKTVKRHFFGLTGIVGESYDRSIADLIGHLRWTRI